jgi:hypothetical protein
MEILAESFGRRIWLYVSPSKIIMDLQDLTPTSEYEKCATVHVVDEVCKALEVEFKKSWNQNFIV